MVRIYAIEKPPPRLSGAAVFLLNDYSTILTVVSIVESGCFYERKNPRIVVIDARIKITKTSR
jgi:hypothetical protein